MNALKRHLTFLNPVSLHQGGLISSQAILSVLENSPHMYEENQQNGPDFLATTKLLSQDSEIVSTTTQLSIYNIEESTSELGEKNNKIITRYPDFIQGMENHSYYFDHHLDNVHFKNNAIGTHYLRRAIMLENAGDSALANDAYMRSKSYTQWAQRVLELSKVCEKVDDVVRLYELFDSSPSAYLEIDFFNTTLVLHKKSRYFAVY
ncbi:hypothetical protein RS130_19085 [Paraglaciecola aquimarina]|uniref:Uncharacterized protein n=1 Tax=Paraglaciecola aquimarina TaxID=1235557 RepID=A0ABU3T0A4_9ALTE|nr:hypothetical protein [Paraglaciecola aquimarina]MDU0355702.1 hypothetical protein [Paraglaciecola aquimarina]